MKVEAAVAELPVSPSADATKAVRLTLTLAQGQRRSAALRALRELAAAQGVELEPVDDDDPAALTVELAGEPLDVDAVAEQIVDWWLARRRQGGFAMRRGIHAWLGGA